MGKKLYVIPISYSYGGGDSVVVLARTIAEARRLAKKFRDTEHVDGVLPWYYSHKQNYIPDEICFGDIDKIPVRKVWTKK